MPHYRKAGKILIPLSPEEFRKGMIEGSFARPEHRGFTALIYYTGVRLAEALRSTEDQFKILEGDLVYDVLKRLKHGMHTPPLNIPLDLPFVKNITYCVDKTKPGSRVWPYSHKTGYNIIARVFHYPHHLRLSRITVFFLPPYNYSIAQVRSWTGLTLKALNYYVGLAEVKKMGKELR